MKIATICRMPKEYFDICEARRCPKEARPLVIIQTKDRDGYNIAEEYAFCDKHLEQFKTELKGGSNE